MSTFTACFSLSNEQSFSALTDSQNSLLPNPFSVIASDANNFHNFCSWQLPNKREKEKVHLSEDLKGTDNSGGIGTGTNILLALSLSMFGMCASEECTNTGAVASIWHLIFENGSVTSKWEFPTRRHGRLAVRTMTLPQDSRLFFGDCLTEDSSSSHFREQTHTRLHANCSSLLPDFNQNRNVSTNFSTTIQHLISLKSVQRFSCS
jgi:hypothetical protein